MSVVVIVGVGLLGGVGATARFLLDGAVSSRLGGSFPWGTFIVNVSGSFLLGALVAAALGEDAFRLLGTGLLGAYTTFSTWTLESHRLGEEGALPITVLNFAVSLALGIGAAWAGRAVGASL